MKLIYTMGKKNMELIETVTHRNLPPEFHGTSSTKGIANIQENYFEALPNGATKWISICDVMPLNFMMRLMLWLMPRAFKKHSLKFMNDFKRFAENGISVAHATA